MKITAVMTLLIASHQLINAQKVENLHLHTPSPSWENVDVKKIADDSLCTSFLIWIRSGVKHHFHASHTECIYILEGEGLMEFGDTEFNVKAGDFVQVPRGTVHAVQANAPMHVLSIQTPQFASDDRVFIAPIRRPHNE